MENKNKNIKADSSQLNSSGLDLLCLNDKVIKKILKDKQKLINSKECFCK